MGVSKGAWRIHSISVCASTAVTGAGGLGLSQKYQGSSPIWVGGEFGQAGVEADELGIVMPGDCEKACVHDLTVTAHRSGGKVGFLQGFRHVQVSVAGCLAKRSQDGEGFSESGWVRKDLGVHGEAEKRGFRQTAGGPPLLSVGGKPGSGCPVGL